MVGRKLTQTKLLRLMIHGTKIRTTISHTIHTHIIYDDDDDEDEEEMNGV